MTGLAKLAAHFIRQSLLAGVDVAGRALAPRLPLQPGFLQHVSHLPPGGRRDAYLGMTSLLPGTLPVPASAADQVVAYHCLDVSQPVLPQLARDERLFAGAFPEKVPGRL